jgi:intracellular septation protein A
MCYFAPMKSLLRVLVFAVNNFGPLIGFYVINSFYGFRTAILVSIAIVVVEVLYKLIRKREFTGFFWFSVLITLVFGALDLWVQTPIFFRYESVITNIITGIYFGMTLRPSSKSFIQEWVEKKEGKPLENPTRILRTRLVTGVWTFYFFAKAAFYLYVNQHYSYEQAFWIRTTIGTGSFYALLGISIFWSRPILNFLQRFYRQSGN